MAQLLIRVIDKINTDDFYLNLQCTKRGDVIAVVEDDHEWGSEELTNPEWRILKFPGVPIEKFTQFLSGEKQRDPNQPVKILQKRQVKFDLDSLDKDHSAYIADDSRQTSVFVSNLSETDVSEIQIIKEPVPSLDVLEL